MKYLLLPALMAVTAPLALAKLPPPDDAAKAKAAEAAAKTAWQGKVDAFKLCKSQDRVAAHYRKTQGGAAKTAAAPAKPASGAAAAPAAPAPCVDPGPFVYTPAAVAAAPAASAPAKPASAPAPAKKG